MRKTFYAFALVLAMMIPASFALAAEQCVRPFNCTFEACVDVPAGGSAHYCVDYCRAWIVAYDANGNVVATNFVACIGCVDP